MKKLFAFLVISLFAMNIFAQKDLSKVDKKDTVKTEITAKDSTTTAIVLPVKPEKGSKPIEWIGYVIALIAFFVLKALSFIPALQKINIPIVQRFISKTSNFMKKLQTYCVIISGIITVLLAANIFGVGITSILSIIFIVTTAIASTTLFTTNKPELIK